MKRFLYFLPIIFAFLVFLHCAEAEGNIGKSDPVDCETSYMRWTNLARTEVKTKYSNASIVDFLYVGCKPQSPTTKTFIYKYWLKESSRSFGVYVSILVNTELNKATNLTLEETSALNPQYGKWRRLAVENIRKQYPHAAIVDYRPCSCQTTGEHSASQTFKFWLTQNGKWKFIYVTIHYQIGTEDVTSVVFQEKSG